MEEMFTEDELKFFKSQDRKMQKIMKLVIPIGNSTYDKLKNDMTNEYLANVLELCNEVMAFCIGFLVGDEDEDEVQ